MKPLVLFLLLMALYYFITLAWMRFDLKVNPWLKQVGFRWYQFFTTHHAMTIWYNTAYPKNPGRTLVLLGVYAAIASVLTVLAIL